MSAGVDVIRIGQTECFRLYGFPTRSAELQPEHRTWLRAWVRRRFNERQHYDIVGMASRLRFRESPDPELNSDLSRRRARAVETFIIRALMDEHIRRNGTPNGVLMPNMDVSVRGVGTSASQVAGTDINDEGHRAVLLIPGRETQLGEAITVRPSVPAMSRGRNFWIKYLGGASMTILAPEGTLCAFLIRDPNGYSQDYAYCSVGAGLGAPVSFANKLPPPDGWVEFAVRSPVLVDSFGGPAQVAAGGAQAFDAGVSWMGLTFGMGRGPNGRSISVSVPSGEGFSLGVGASILGGLIAVGEPQRGRWRYQ